MAVVVPEKFAIMAVDPGETTGVAQAFLNATRGSSTKALLRRAVRKEAVRVAQVVPAEHYVGGPYASASIARQLHAAWLSFLFRAVNELSIPVPNVYLAIEDFQLRQRSANLSPVEVTHAFYMSLMGINGTWPSMNMSPEGRIRTQPASEAKTYATDARLRDWGVWSIGKEHGRDATRHLALRASKILDGDL